MLKLNENRFKPLFTELAEWGTNLPAYAAAAESDEVRAAAATARRAAWLAAVSHLSHALRSLFTPYFQNVLDVMCDALAADAPAPLMRPSRKKQKAAAGGQGDAAPSDAAAVDAEVLRERAVACIHRCCMHDTQGFITADRFERFLAPLVARVAERGAAVAPADRDSAGAQEDGDLTAGLALGTRTRLPHSAVAAVAALVQLGVCAQEDAAWKRLNNQVRLLSHTMVLLHVHHTPAMCRRSCSVQATSPHPGAMLCRRAAPPSPAGWLREAEEGTPL